MPVASFTAMRAHEPAVVAMMPVIPEIELICVVRIRHRGVAMGLMVRTTTGNKNGQGNNRDGREGERTSACSGWTVSRRHCGPYRWCSRR